MAVVALITGITGQTGSYLAEYLLERGLAVHGLVRRASQTNTDRIDHIFGHERLHLHYGDVTDQQCLTRLVARHRPAYVYHMAALSHVATSFELPDTAMQVNALGTLRVLEAVRAACDADGAYAPRIYLASTSEEYGNTAAVQDEATATDPRSPYAVSKETARRIGALYRDAYGMHVVIGTCFNHESPRRDVRFVTRKVTRAVAQFVVRPDAFQPVRLGNLAAQRDWTHARDMVRGIVAMTERDGPPRDYVLASGRARSVRELVEAAFAARGVAVKWCGSGTDERGVCPLSGRTLVVVDPRYFRPCEVHHLCGNASRAHEELGWRPSVGFEALIEEMVAADVAQLRAKY